MILDEKSIIPQPAPNIGPSPAYSSRNPFRNQIVASSPSDTLVNPFQVAPNSTPHTPTFQRSSTPTFHPAPILPASILLQIIHHTFPQATPHVPTYFAGGRAHADSDLDYNYTYTGEHPLEARDSVGARRRRTLLWLGTSLRRVSRAWRAACTHVLRRAHLPAYRARVRAPYSSDAFPFPYAPALDVAGAGDGACRETAVLDRFALLKARADVRADESSLHLGYGDAFRDVFDVAQPRARLEDLVRALGVWRGVVCLPGSSDGHDSDARPGAGPDADEGGAGAHDVEHTAYSNSAEDAERLRAAEAQLDARASALAQLQYAAQSKKKASFSLFKRSASKQGKEPAPALPVVQALPFSCLTVSFQPRAVGIVLGRTRTLVEVPRAPGRRETLEVLAERLVDGLVEELGAR